MTNLELQNLKDGDIIQNHSGSAYVVLRNMGKGVIATRTLEVTNASEWEHVYTTTPVREKLFTRPLVETEVKSPAYLPSAFVMQEELHAAGWKRASYDQWTDPAGVFYRGPVGAWKNMRRRRVVACTAAGARSTSPPVKTFQEARAELHAAGWTNVCGRVWRSPSGGHFDGTKLAYDAMNSAGGNPS